MSKQIDEENGWAGMTYAGNDTCRANFTGFDDATYYMSILKYDLNSYLDMDYYEQSH